MSSEDLYRLIGYLDPGKENEVGFLHPVFEKNDKHFIQIIDVFDRGSFIELFSEYTAKIFFFDNVRIKKSVKDKTDSIHLFKISNSDFILGNRLETISIISNRIDEFYYGLNLFNKYKFFYYLGFSGIASRLMIQLQKSTKSSYILKKPKIINSIKNLMREFIPLKHLYNLLVNCSNLRKTIGYAVEDYFKMTSNYIYIGNYKITKHVFGDYLTNERTYLSNRTYSTDIIETILILLLLIDYKFDNVFVEKLLFFNQNQFSPGNSELYKLLLNKVEMTQTEANLFHALSGPVESTDIGCPTIRNNEYENRSIELVGEEIEEELYTEKLAELNKSKELLIESFET